MINNNILLMTDSYKTSHYLQYPKKAERYYGYIESRGGKFDATVFFGLQIFLKRYLSKPITQEMIDEAEEFINTHMGTELFNREGWEYILNEYGGYIPVTIRAVPEGTIVPTLNALVTVEVTDPKVFWVGSYIETTLLRAVWYPTTVATVSYNCKQTIMKYLELTSDDPLGQILFKLHDFGARGVSSKESAEIGGAAHLVNFMGSDNMEGIWVANKAYNIPMAAFSINAAEHSTITCWGKDNEVDAYRNMLKQFANNGSLVAVVSDSYDIYNAVEKIWGEELRQEVINSGATIIIRPDSGNPPEVVLKTLKLLGSKFGYTTNSKGYKVLNHVKVIQGDGINYESIKDICSLFVEDGWSVDNVAFGMGGALLQQLDRDTQKFAMKCSALFIDGKWVDVYKDPVTDSGKRSKRGRISLFEDANGDYHTLPIGFTDETSTAVSALDVLVPVYKDGKILVDYTLEEVRNNTNR